MRGWYSAEAYHALRAFMSGNPMLRPAPVSGGERQDQFAGLIDQGSTELTDAAFGRKLLPVSAKGGRSDRLLGVCVTSFL